MRLAFGNKITREGEKKENPAISDKIRRRNIKEKKKKNTNRILV